MSNPAINFFPPRLNLLFVRLCQTLMPWVTHLHYQFDLDVDCDSLNQLIDLRHDRVLLLPNHPTFHEPIVLFLLAGRLGQAFYYLGAHEQFQGFLGKLLQRAGGYSIRRGLADRASIAQTLALLAQPECHLVIFPEGGCSFQNDTVMPFRVGAIQMAFQAMAKDVRQGHPIPDLYVVPISIKYRYTQPMDEVIDRTLTRLEQALADRQTATGKLPQEKPAHKNGIDGISAYERLRAIASHVLVQMEHEYSITPMPQVTWNDRIQTLKRHVLNQCEQHYGLKSAEDEHDRERAYKILSAMQMHAEALEAGEGAQDTVWTGTFIRKSMIRLLNFDAIYDGYVAEQPTPERFLDTLTRLEREVLGIDQPAPKGHRIAKLTAGTPINLKHHWESYQLNKSATVTLLTHQLQQTVQANLQGNNKTRDRSRAVN
jgi:1-acyl-sn-glycerol-3-phosphate acyltransferase